MRVIKIVFAFALLITISNNNIDANPILQHDSSQMMSLNTDIEININGTKYSINTPQDAISNPITVKIIDDGEVIFQRTITTKTNVTSDAIDFGVRGDNIYGRVTSDAVNRLRSGDTRSSVLLKISQDETTIFTKQI